MNWLVRRGPETAELNQCWVTWFKAAIQRRQGVEKCEGPRPASGYPARSAGHLRWERCIRKEHFFGSLEGHCTHVMKKTDPRNAAQICRWVGRVFGFDWRTMPM
ncbi:hypothetical protein SKAU_G00138990 [Synaphobranchus kaupii]|uniref:Uncharacterized protein n=1 Tax=Synaphobranchus kaupii TaxID=118154 RepID=A0A9Q1FS25_SYNKA|nr:hypothetical protein SKAU_G00138990 [Synaphobranchus kaupii]